MPGHHYQKQVAAKSQKKFQISEYFDYPGYGEGWAAYTESLGLSLGVYRDLYSLLGKWEWDLVRSARVVLDVGINYLGWSRQQAIDFWQESIPNQDSIMIREIDRIIRWPAQVASYKVGEVRFRNLRKQAEQQTGSEFDARRFHSLLLDQGPLPLEVLSKITTSDPS
jgi:uncharacterized protein (DUF885 family)